MSVIAAHLYRIYANKVYYNYRESESRFIIYELEVFVKYCSDSSSITQTTTTNYKTWIKHLVNFLNFTYRPIGVTVIKDKF